MTATATAPAKASSFTSFVSYVRSLFKAAGPDAKELIERVRKMDAERKALIEQGTEIRRIAQGLELRRDNAARQFYKDLAPLSFMRLVDCEQSVLAVKSILSSGTSAVLSLEHAQGRFEAAFPNYRKTLIGAVDALLALAKEGLQQARDAEGERFAQMGQPHLDVERSPIVQQSRAVVYTFEETRKKADSAEDESVWQNVAPVILRYAPSFVDDNTNAAKS